MKLNLGIAKVCGPEGCEVDLMDGLGTLEALYSSKVRDVVRIRRGQLVVVDRGAEPPELVYRVARLGEVRAVEGDRASVVAHDAEGDVLADADGREEQEVSTVEVSRPVVERDQVFFTGGSEGRVVALAVDGRPADPDRVRSAVFPTVQAIYEG